MSEKLNPWSADFYFGATQRDKNEIQHGGPGSGRYPKGSGGDQKNTGGKSVDSLPNFRALKGASKAEIAQAEKSLGVKFSKEFKTLVEKHGSFSVNGHEILGVDPAHPRLDTVKVTKEERETFPKTALKDAYVVEDAGIENIKVWQKTDGTIHQTCPDGTYPNGKIADSLTEWVNT